MLTVGQDYRALFPDWRDPRRLRLGRHSRHNPARPLFDGPGGALGGERRVESPYSQLSLGRLLIFPEIDEAECKLTATPAEAFGGGRGLARLLCGFVLDLELLR